MPEAAWIRRGHGLGTDIYLEVWSQPTLDGGRLGQSPGTPACDLFALPTGLALVSTEEYLTHVHTESTACLIIRSTVVLHTKTAAASSSSSSSSAIRPHCPDVSPPKTEEGAGVRRVDRTGTLPLAAPWGVAGPAASGAWRPSREGLLY